ncbi:MAG TPA: DUF3096 domain-containing protein [Bryobacteraceae bacterium]|jgi:hypothetical protein
MTRMGLRLNQLARGAIKNCADARSDAKPGYPAIALILLIVVQAVFTQSALAQTRGGAVTLRYTSLGPIIALLAGILILIVPRLLNYVVAVYLILVGLIGLFGV